MLTLCYIVLNSQTAGKANDIKNVSLKKGLLQGLCLIGGFSVLEIVLIRLFADSPDYIITGADFLSGIVGGVTMALFISRLHSRLLGTSIWLPIVPIVLYLYVVIQPFYTIINRTSATLSPGYKLCIIQLAFMLKSIMYIYVTELFRSQRLLFYMIHARRIYDDMEEKWNQFRSGRNVVGK